VFDELEEEDFEDEGVFVGTGDLMVFIVIEEITHFGVDGIEDHNLDTVEDTRDGAGNEVGVPGSEEIFIEFED